MTSIRQRALLLAGLAGAALSAGGAAVAVPRPPMPVSSEALVRPDDDAATFKKLMDEVSPSIITVKLVLKYAGGGYGEGEQETETVGVMIDPKGIILASSVKTGGTPGGREGGPTITPTDVKVLIGDDTEGKKATILTRDSDLDLAWIRIDESSSTPYMHVDLANAADAGIGQRLFVVDRLGKFYDRTPVISEGRVRGITDKPRRLMVPSDGLASDLGLPVLTSDGKVVGVTMVLFPDAEMGNDEDQRPRLMILPAAEVVKATKHAMENPTPPAAPAPEKPKDGPEAAPKPDKP